MPSGESRGAYLTRRSTFVCSPSFRAPCDIVDRKIESGQREPRLCSMTDPTVVAVAPGKKLPISKLREQCTQNQ
jgi:hypothetical protein